jgi:transposase
MIASAESITVAPAPIVSSSPAPPLAHSSSRRPWKPDGDAHLIYQWVKMDGKSQGQVAAMLGISQPSVSRTIQRYERWQAHAKEREDGRLDPAERLRAQRWLTFERNELIIASCLRIANEMEGFIDMSKSTVRRPLSSHCRESEVRTEHATIDRSGVAARFLRLAFRINMEQLKLAELDQPPAAPPLSDEELAEEERQAAADADELAAARAARQAEPSWADETPAESQDVAWAPSTSQCGTSEQVCGEAATAPADAHAAAGEAHPTTDSSPAALNNLNNLHNENVPETAASACPRCTCASQPATEKILCEPCITPDEPPQWTTSDAQHSSVPAAA